MPAFATSTINDFLAQLQMQTERAVQGFKRDKNDIDSRCSKAGMTQSSRRIVLLLDAIDEHVERGVSMLLAELRRALGHPHLDPLELRNLIGPRLDELASSIITAATLGQASRSLQSQQVHDMIETRTAKVRSNVLFWLRQFDVGWDEPVEPEPLKRPPNSH